MNTRYGLGSPPPKPCEIKYIKMSSFSSYRTGAKQNKRIQIKVFINKIPPNDCANFKIPICSFLYVVIINI